MATFLTLANITQRGSRLLPILNKHDARLYVCPDWQLGNCLLGNNHCDLCQHCAAHCRCGLKRVTPLRQVAVAYTNSLSSHHIIPKTAMQPDRTVCHKCNKRRNLCQCKRCSACYDLADLCKCPFPSKAYFDEETQTVRSGYGRKHYEADMEAIDKQQAGMSVLMANGLITGMEHHAACQKLERMRKRCAGRLFAIAKLMQDREKDFKGEQAATTRLEASSPKLLYPAKDSFGRTLSTSAVQAIKKASDKGW